MHDTTQHHSIAQYSSNALHTKTEFKCTKRNRSNWQQRVKRAIHAATMSSMTKAWTETIKTEDAQTPCQKSCPNNTIWIAPQCGSSQTENCGLKPQDSAAQSNNIQHSELRNSVRRHNTTATMRSSLTVQHSQSAPQLRRVLTAQTTSKAQSDTTNRQHKQHRYQLWCSADKLTRTEKQNT